MREIYVTPKKGLVVVDPADMQDVPADGKKVTNSQYWQRRKRDGDVTISKPAAAKSAPAKAPAKS